MRVREWCLIYSYLEVGKKLSISCTQLWRLCLTSMPKLRLRGYKVGPAGLGFLLFGTDLLVDATDYLLKSVVGCFGPKHGVARPAGLDFPSNASNQLPLCSGWSSQISHLVSLNLIEFASSCGRPIHGESLPHISFVFPCISSA